MRGVRRGAGEYPEHRLTSESKRPSRKERFQSTCVILGQQYVACMALALLFQLTLHDSSPLFFAASSLALYFFAPLPLLIPIAIWTRRRELLIGAAIFSALWLGHWGKFFSPTRLAQPSQVELRVATYNLLGFNSAPEATIQELRSTHADLVSLQELNPKLGAAIERELADVYPYRWLDAQPGVRGGGVLSRWPLEPIASDAGLAPDLGWVGKPMVSRVTIGERQLYFIQFHTASGTAAFRAREQQAEAIRDFAQQADLPVIAAGDFNATDTSRAYSIAREGFEDAWADVGLGFGHTFPGEPGPERGGSRPVLAGIPAPKWLIRIDFIFYTQALEAREAAIVPSSGGSDHRMLTAGFRWK